MKIGIISDIHSNSEALNSVLENIKEIMNLFAWEILLVMALTPIIASKR